MVSEQDMLTLLILAALFVLWLFARKNKGD